MNELQKTNKQTNKQTNKTDTTSLIRNKRQTSTTLESLLSNRPSVEKVSEIVKGKKLKKQK